MNLYGLTQIYNQPVFTALDYLIVINVKNILNSSQIFIINYQEIKERNKIAINILISQSILLLFKH